MTNLEELENDISKFKDTNTLTERLIKTINCPGYIECYSWDCDYKKKNAIDKKVDGCVFCKKEWLKLDKEKS